MRDVRVVGLRGLRGRMSGCGDIHASSIKREEALGLFLRRISRVGVIANFCNAGVRPGSRPTFVSAKVGKTSDAPPELIGLLGRGEGGDGLTRRARTSPARRRASDHGDGRQASDQRSNLVPQHFLIPAKLLTA
ncbi:hypothetical protein [Nitrospira sp. Ecomares 2.1]